MGTVIRIEARHDGELKPEEGQGLVLGFHGLNQRFAAAQSVLFASRQQIQTGIERIATQVAGSTSKDEQHIQFQSRHEASKSVQRSCNSCTLAASAAA